MPKPYIDTYWYRHQPALAHAQAKLLQHSKLAAVLSIHTVSAALSCLPLDAMITDPASTKHHLGWPVPLQLPWCLSPPEHSSVRVALIACHLLRLLTCLVQQLSSRVGCQLLFWHWVKHGVSLQLRPLQQKQQQQKRDKLMIRTGAAVQAAQQQQKDKLIIRISATAVQCSAAKCAHTKSDCFTVMTSF